MGGIIVGGGGGWRAERGGSGRRRHVCSLSVTVVACRRECFFLLESKERFTACCLLYPIMINLRRFLAFFLDGGGEMEK